MKLPQFCMKLSDAVYGYIDSQTEERIAASFVKNDAMDDPDEIARATFEPSSASYGSSSDAAKPAGRKPPLRTLT